MTRIARVHSRFGGNPRLKIGDRVVVKPENRTGVVIGVRYGEIAGANAFAIFARLRFAARHRFCRWLKHLSGNGICGWKAVCRTPL